MIHSNHETIHRNTFLNIITVNVSSAQLGVNMNQILSIQQFQSSKNDHDQLVYIHNALNLKEKIDYKSPHIFWVKNIAPPIGLILNEPQQIINISIKQIKPLPPIIKKYCIYDAVWGVVANGHEFIVLIDVIRLINGMKYTLNPERA